MILTLSLLLACGALFPNSKNTHADDTGSSSVDDSGGDDSGPVDTGQDVASLDPDSLPQGAAPCREPAFVHVDEAIDGDTLAVTGADGSEHVRIIGLDTPEIAHSEPADCYGNEAWAFTEREIEGTDLWLTFDGDCYDYYDRTLAYIIRGTGEQGFFERVLLQQGYATVLPYSDTSTFEDVFAQDEAAAKAAGLGLWSACE